VACDDERRLKLAHHTHFSSKNKQKIRTLIIIQKPDQSINHSNMLNKIIRLLVFFAFLGLVESKWLGCFSCPTSDDYSAECVENITPPWPICLLHTTDEWVDKAMDSASRCCGDDLTKCKCPKKDTQKFLDGIGDYCDGVATCADDVKKLIAEEINENSFLSEE
jgi:hypothetical protein